MIKNKNETRYSSIHGILFCGLLCQQQLEDRGTGQIAPAGTIAVKGTAKSEKRRARVILYTSSRINLTSTVT